MPSELVVPNTGELPAVAEATLSVRVNALEQSMNAIERYVDERNHSNEGMRRAHESTLAAMLERLKDLEENGEMVKARTWQVMSATINLIAGAVIALIVSWLTK